MCGIMDESVEGSGRGKRRSWLRSTRQDRQVGGTAQRTTQVRYHDLVGAVF